MFLAFAIVLKPKALALQAEAMTLVPYRLSTDSKTRDLNDLESPFRVKFCFVPVCLEL